jgi:hypothetical protein
MTSPRDLLPAHARLLANAVAVPESVRDLTADDWDLLIRVAGRAELLGTLHSRLARAGMLGFVPDPPRRHLKGALVFYEHRAQMARYLMSGLEHALRDFEGAVVLLKGAAYVMQGLPFSVGRLFDDVDILVSRERLDDVERLLASHGWESEKPDAYDQHYYRAWAHELPPMRHARYVLQLDVHHTILPVTGRIRPVAPRLVTDAVALPGTRWCVLSPEDQLLHACAHLFQDSDCVSRIRELVDIDGLVRQHDGPGFGGRLLERARLHGLARPLWYAMRYAARWLDTPVPAGLQPGLDSVAPLAPVRRVMDAAVAAALFPPHPDARPPAIMPISHRALTIRSVWLRMPPWLLAYHATMKALPALKGGPRTGGAP